MNRYPVWKYAIIAIALLVGALYTLPNFFGEAPAVQVSSAKAVIKVDAALQARVQAALQEAGITPDSVSLDGNSIRALIKYLDNIADDAIVGVNVPNGIPLVYELDANLKPIRHYYLGDAEAAAKAAAAVASQGKA